ncbi:MAG: glutathione S-transferase family protein [Polyangiaceae bacterium]
MPPQSPPRLYNAPSSYYSMIARLALVEAKVPFTSVKLDIHRRREQLSPAYARLNPNMTVPTLELADRVLTDSRDITLHAFPGATDDASTRWLDRHYDFSIEELTFGWMLLRNRLARWVVPRQLASIEGRLREYANANPDLSERYLRRAEVFAERRRTFDPAAASTLYAMRMREARERLDELDDALADEREVLVGGVYGPADVVWTVFLARIRFIGEGDEIERRPALSRWARAVFGRASFREADVWARLAPLKLLAQIL